MLALVIAGCVAGALVLAEIGARVFIRTRPAYFVWKPGLRYLLETDRDVLPEMEPTVRLEINSAGERGGPPPAARDHQIYRVLVAGGSAAECYFLDQETSWPGALQKLLGTPSALGALGAKRVHVGNVARSLFGAAYLDRVFERILPRYEQLDLIVLMVGATDVVKWIGRGCPPELDRETAPARLIFHEHPEMKLGLHPRTWGLAELARRARLRWLRPVEVRQRAGKMLEAARRMRAAAEEMRADCPDPAPMLDRFEQHFRTVLRRAQTSARRVVVVHQPCFAKERHSPEEEAHFWGLGIGDPYHEKVTVYYTTQVVARLMQLMNERAAKVAAARGVECLDLMPLLDRSLRTYYDFFHFTPAGSAAVARAVADKILAGPPPPPPEATPVRERPGLAVQGK